MKFINLKRRNGKTTMLIHTAYVTGYPIITGTTQERKFVKELAAKMGLENIEVYAVGEWKDIFIHSSTKTEKVLIDEAENIIDFALRDLLQAEIVAASFSIPMIELPTSKDEKKEAQDNADN